MVPSFSNQTVSINALLANPSRLSNVIAKLMANQLVLDAFYTPIGERLSGGGLLYAVLVAGSNFTKRDAEKCSPGAEYVMTAVDAPQDLATPEDYGAKIEIYHEERDRNDIITLGNRLNQLRTRLSARWISAPSPP